MRFRAFKITSAESPPSKNLDQKWSGFFYWKCPSKPCQLCNSGVLPLNGLGWLNVLMSIGNGHLTRNLPTKLPTKFYLPTKSDNLSEVFAYQILCHILVINNLKRR